MYGCCFLLRSTSCGGQVRHARALEALQNFVCLWPLRGLREQSPYFI